MLCRPKTGRETTDCAAETYRTSCDDYKGFDLRLPAELGSWPCDARHCIEALQLVGLESPQQNSPPQVHSLGHQAGSMRGRWGLDEQ